MLINRFVKIGYLDPEVALRCATFISKISHSYSFNEGEESLSCNAALLMQLEVDALPNYS